MPACWTFPAPGSIMRRMPTSIALFTPWPPQPSGIAGRSAELARELAQRGHAVDVFVDLHDRHLSEVAGSAPDQGPTPGDIRVQSAHDFPWRHRRGQYQLAVYQLGNSRLHEFIWPYLFRYPGLAILHDARLHHARGRALLRRKGFADYRTEFVWNHPGAVADLAELGVRGFDGPYYYQWPMTRAIVLSSRVTACHSRGAAEELREQYPDRTIEYVALGEGPDTFDVGAARAAFRARHGIDRHGVLFGVHGALTAEKRVPQILRAFATARPGLGGSRLILAGRPDPALALDRQIAELELGDAVHLIEDLTDADFDEAIAATDVCLNLRWPTALETSGPWVRSLALSRPTVVVDLVHQRHLPVLDPRTWRRHAPCEDPSPGADDAAVAVAVDILDEEHSLRLALRRLAADSALRARLGARARAWWEREHTVTRMVDDVERAAMAAIDAPAPPAGLPPHLRPDPAAWAKALVAPFGLELE